MPLLNTANWTRSLWLKSCVFCRMWRFNRSSAKHLTTSISNGLRAERTYRLHTDIMCGIDVFFAIIREKRL